MKKQTNPPKAVTVPQEKWANALKYLMGTFNEPFPNLTVKEMRMLGKLAPGNTTMTLDEAAAALKRLGWKPAIRHETEFLSSAAKQQDWEEAIFRNATHFNVFRLHRRVGDKPKERESTAYHTFPEAVAQAGGDIRALVYAVTKEGSNFCVPRKEWDKYKAIWSER